MNSHKVLSMSTVISFILLIACAIVSYKTGFKGSAELLGSISGSFFTFVGSLYVNNKLINKKKVVENHTKQLCYEMQIENFISQLKNVKDSVQSIIYVLGNEKKNNANDNAQAYACFCNILHYYKIFYSSDVLRESDKKSLTSELSELKLHVTGFMNNYHKYYKNYSEFSNGMVSTDLKFTSSEYLDKLIDGLNNKVLKPLKKNLK